MSEPGSGEPRRLFSLPRAARRVERDVDDELQFHIDARTADLIADGMSADAARAQAVTEFGDLAASRRELAGVDRDRLRTERWTDALDALRRDLAYGLRMLRTQPGFAAGVI